jgi:hypothetical protein
VRVLARARPREVVCHRLTVVDGVRRGCCQRCCQPAAGDLHLRQGRRQRLEETAGPAGQRSESEQLRPRWGFQYLTPARTVAVCIHAPVPRHKPRRSKKKRRQTAVHHHCCCNASHARANSQNATPPSLLTREDKRSLIMTLLKVTLTELVKHIHMIVTFFLY